MIIRESCLHRLLQYSYIQNIYAIYFRHLRIIPRIYLCILYIFKSRIILIFTFIVHLSSNYGDLCSIFSILFLYNFDDFLNIFAHLPKLLFTMAPDMSISRSKTGGFSSTGQALYCRSHLMRRWYGLLFASVCCSLPPVKTGIILAVNSSPVLTPFSFSRTPRSLLHFFCRVCIMPSVPKLSVHYIYTYISIRVMIYISLTFFLYAILIGKPLFYRSPGEWFLYTKRARFSPGPFV